MDERRGTADNGRREIVHRLSSIALCGALALAARPAWGDKEQMPGLDLSTKKDALRAVDQGIQWLKARQNADGSWPPSPQPAVSAFATRAILRDPAREQGKLDASAGKGLEFIASCAQKDGGIYRDSRLPGARGNYGTAASVLALAGSQQERYEPLILAARRFLARGQNRREGSDQFGGWACSDPPADMKTTALAIEALAATQRIATADAEKSRSAPADPDWTAAVAFLSRCQNLPPACGEWPQDLGGFFDVPDKAGPLTTRHPEGSATALGLAALLESNVARSDPRVLGAVNWLRANYTLDEPAGGLDRRGPCFYYYSLAGALSLYGEEPLLRAEKRPAGWRRELMIRLISLQRTDSQGLGYWVNDQGDNAEKDAVLVTAYCVLALETLADAPPY
jgi:squalene-hopene/tetraprenyl-beta-curcumene cyclase